MSARWPEVADALLRERGRALFGYAYLLAGSVEDAEDLVQSAVIKTFSRVRSFDGVGPAEAYVRQVIRTLFIDDRRRARHRVERPGVDADLGLASGTSAADDRLILGRALATLPPRERACVVLRFYDDMTTGDIARALGLAPGSVRRYLSDAIRKLERALGDLGLDAETVLSGGTETVPVLIVAASAREKP